MLKKITLLSFIIALTPVVLMWAVFFADVFYALDLYRWGNHPLHIDGIPGIILSPFIHNASDPGHILNNTIPAFILLWMLYYHYRIVATRSLILIWILSGAGLWLLGRESYHVGMSSIIYGLSSFLTFSGFFRKSLRVAGVSLLVIFLYGSMVWGIFPIKEGISWEGHLCGLCSGLIAAMIFRKSPPQVQKMQYEIDEEMGIEPVGGWWEREEVERNENELRDLTKH